MREDPTSVRIDPEFGDTVRRARADYLEMPDLRLTPSQAARLWACDAVLCEDVLAALVEMRFLTRSREGFIRVSSQR